MIETLIEAIKKGKISKQLARFIVKKLLKNSVEVDAELLALTDLK